MMMIMMMIIIIIIIIIIITMMMMMIIITCKGAVRHFLTISSLRREPSPATYAHVARAHSCANHVQHTERPPRATCRVTCYVVQRDNSAIAFDRV